VRAGGESLGPAARRCASGEATFILGGPESPWTKPRLYQRSIPKGNAIMATPGNTIPAEIGESKYGKPPLDGVGHHITLHSKTPPALLGVARWITRRSQNLTAAPPSKWRFLSPRQPGDRPHQLKLERGHPRSARSNKADRESSGSAPAVAPLWPGSRSRLPGLRHPLSGPPSPTQRNLCNRCPAGSPTGHLPRYRRGGRSWCAKPTGALAPSRNGWSPITPCPGSRRCRSLGICVAGSNDRPWPGNARAASSTARFALNRAIASPSRSAHEWVTILVARPERVEQPTPCPRQRRTEATPARQRHGPFSSRPG